MSYPVEIYKALADESRLRILALLEQGFFNVQELTSILELGQSTISHHLKLLQTAGLTTRHREGTWIYYRLAPDPEFMQREILSSYRSLRSGLDGSEFRLLLDRDRETARKILERRREETRQFFESIGGQWKETRPNVSGEDLIIEELLSQIPAEAKFLELGCGSGALLERLLPRNGETVGVDYSRAMLEEAKEHLQSKADEIDLRLGDLEHLPLGDDSVHAAAAYMVFHHLPNPPAALRDAARVLSPGGELHVVDLMPHENEMMRERYGDRWLGFDPNEFCSWARECNLTQSSLRFYGENKEVFFLTLTKED